MKRYVVGDEYYPFYILLEDEKCYCDGEIELTPEELLRFETAVKEFEATVQSAFQLFFWVSIIILWGMDLPFFSEVKCKANPL
jgi:hypothetical protein